VSIDNIAPLPLSCPYRATADATLSSPGIATIEIRQGEDLLFTIPLNRNDLRSLQLWLGLLEDEVRGGSDGERAYRYTSGVTIGDPIGGVG
jgi:hypothetical protein